MFNFFSHFFRGYRIDYYTEDEMLGGEMHLVDMLSNVRQNQTLSSVSCLSGLDMLQVQ